MKPVTLPNHNDDSFKAFGLVLRALCTIANQQERALRYRRALVDRHPAMAASFRSLGYPL